MLRLITAFIICLIVSGCSSNSKTVQTHPAEESEDILVQSRTLAADNHLEQGKALYFKGKYSQASKHLVRSIANNFRSWESHYFLGLCQQKQGRHDRAIGSFNNALKFCPIDKLIAAKLSYHLGFSWEKEGYLHKASEKYSSALKLNPDLAAAQMGVERIKAKTENADTKTDGKDDIAF